MFVAYVRAACVNVCVASCVCILGGNSGHVVCAALLAHGRTVVLLGHVDGITALPLHQHRLHAVLRGGVDAVPDMAGRAMRHDRCRAQHRSGAGDLGG